MGVRDDRLLNALVSRCGPTLVVLAEERGRLGRAMASGAAHRVDRVLPHVRVLQWSVQREVLRVLED